MNSRSLLFALALFVLMGGFTSTHAQESSFLRFDPNRRVYLPSKVASPGVVELESSLRRVGLDRGAKYYVVVLGDTPQVLHQYANDVRARWSAHQAFDVSTSTVVVCAAGRPEVAILPPDEVTDRLALSPAWMQRKMIDPNFDYTPDPEVAPLAPVSLGRLSKALTRLIERVDERLGRIEEQRRGGRVKGREEFETFSEQLERSAKELSGELAGLELRCLSMRHRGFDVRREQDQLQETRRAFSAALDSLSYARERSSQGLEQVRAQLGRLSKRLDLLSAARSRLDETLTAVNEQLKALDRSLELANVGSPARQEARALRQAAKKDLEEALAQRDAGRPDLALARFESLLASVSEAQAILNPAPAPEAVPTPSDAKGEGFPWLLLGIGLLAIVAMLVHISMWLTRSQARILADSLQETTARQAEDLRREIDALRSLYLQARTPERFDVPERILPSVPPLARHYRGETARRLARARARLAELHSLWRSLQQALLHADVARSQDSAYSTRSLLQAIDVLEHVPARNLPVLAIRETAQLFEQIARSPATCAKTLAETAASLDRAEASLDRLLQAGQSTRHLDEEFARIVESAVEAAFHAQADPMGAIRTAQHVKAVVEHLDEQVERTLEVAAGRDRAVAELEKLSPDGVPGPSQDRDLPSLLTWSQHLTDRVTLSLDEGARDQATTDLGRAVALLHDAQKLSNGGSDDPGEDLERLRDELHHARLAFDELQGNFARDSWDDLEGALHRAAARIENLSVDLDKGGRVQRLSSRLDSIRGATLLASSRLLHVRAERERVQGMLESLEARATAIGDYLDRESEAITPATSELHDHVLSELQRISGEASAEEPPVWNELLLGLLVTEQELYQVRVQAGEDVLRNRRVWILKRSLEKGIRDGEDLLRRKNARPGAEARLEDARQALAWGETAMQDHDLNLALAHFQQGVRAAHNARDITDHRGLRAKFLDRGILGDAQHALVLAGQELGNAARHYCLGDGSDVPEGWRLLEEAGATLEANPPRALQVATSATRLAMEAIAQGLARAARTSEETLELRRQQGKQLQLMRRRGAELIRTAENHRRARFEIFGLGEEPDLAEVQLREEDDSEELEALEEMTASEAEIALHAPPSEEGRALPQGAEPEVEEASQEEDALADSDSTEGEGAASETEDAAEVAKDEDAEKPEPKSEEGSEASDDGDPSEATTEQELVPYVKDDGGEGDAPSSK